MHKREKCEDLQRVPLSIQGNGHECVRKLHESRERFRGEAWREQHPARTQGQALPVPTARLEKLWVHRALSRVKGVLPQGEED